MVGTTPFSSTGPQLPKTVVTVQAELAVGFVAVHYFFIEQSMAIALNLYSAMYNFHCNL